MKKTLTLGLLLLSVALPCSAFAAEFPAELQTLCESVPQIAEVEAYAAHPVPFGNGTLLEWLSSDEPRDGISPAAWRFLQQTHAESLVWAKAYDEALSLFAHIPTAESETPEMLVFFKAIAAHQLLQKDTCLKALEELEPLKSRLPKRYGVLANLMKMDMDALKDGKLDYISRQMKDVRRRLDGGDTGEKAQDAEKKVIESLDKLIEELEEQERQKQKQMMQSNQNQSRQPGQQAQLKGGPAPGKVDKKNLKAEAAWGNLPPKVRDESMQQIEHDFPPHYRDAIEQYFKRMAE